MELIHSTFKLAAFDIAFGNGIATAHLKSGIQLSGTVNKALSEQEALTLKTNLGWHVIDWTEIAAITGEPHGRR